MKNLLSSKDLAAKQFPEQTWLAQDLLPKIGLAILAGRPKSGKSILALNLSICVAKGLPFLNSYNTKPSKVMYLCYEDSEVRINGRQDTIYSALESDASENIVFDFEPKLLEGIYLDNLKQYVQDNCINMIVVDTLGKAVSWPSSNSSSYKSEYEMTGKFQKLAMELNLTILLVHHTRKDYSDNPFDDVLGTTGVTGAVDTIWVLKDTEIPNQKILHHTGRDIQTDALELEFDDINFLWKYNKPIKLMKVTPEQRDIYDLLLKEGTPLSTSEIAAKLNKKPGNVSNMLKKLKGRYVENPEYGKYRAIII